MVRSIGEGDKDSLLDQSLVSLISLLPVQSTHFLIKSSCRKNFAKSGVLFVFLSVLGFELRASNPVLGLLSPDDD
jgi:hypothetical protein